MDGLNRKKLRDSFSLKDNIIAILIEIRKLFKDSSLKVKINEKQYKIIGRLGMYHSVIDVTDSNVKVGDEVILDIAPIDVNYNIKREYN